MRTIVGNPRLTNPGDDRRMSCYIRPSVPGASVFFTVNLADRGAWTLVEHVDALRVAVRVTRAERPFRIDAWVVLPDHMHAVWTLPEGDADYSVRMGAIKARFTRALTRRVGFHPTMVEDDRGVSRVVDVSGGVEPHPTINGRPRSKSKVMKGDGRVWQRRFLGTPHPGRRGVPGLRPVLLDQSGEARVGGTPERLAVFIMAPRCRG